jgi:hypothetical protein
VIRRKRILHSTTLVSSPGVAVIKDLDEAVPMVQALRMASAIEDFADTHMST